MFTADDLMFWPSESRPSCPECLGGKETASGSDAQWITDPGTAAHDTVVAIFVCDGGAIERRASVAFPEAVLHPLPHVSVHVVDAEGIVLERANGSRVDMSVPAIRNRPLRVLLFGGQIGNVAVVAEVFLFIAEVKPCRASSPRRVFPFRLGQQLVSSCRSCATARASIPW